MRKTKTIKIDSLIKDFIQENELSPKIQRSKIPIYWEQVMGKVIAKRTQNIYLKQNTLIIHLSSSVVRNELMMMRGEIIEKMNEALGEALIHKIVLK